MTQGIYKFPQEQLSFQSDSGKVLPCEIEAEETIIGGILDDPNAIYRIKDRLKPEHFYIGAHKDIYQACLRLCNKGKPNDLLSVTSLLRDHGILAKVGGQNKLASVMKWNVSTVNIDHMADLVIKSSVFRQVIKLGGEITSFGYETQRELPDLLAEITERTRSIIETPIAPTRDEHEQWLHDRLLNELTTIYTTCSQPSLRLLKLKRLADEHHFSTKFLEHFYLKTLIAQCTELLTYEELKELAGSTVREWLLNGLIPQSTTILLASDGGVGKTKFAYAIGKILIQGTQFGPFVTTGKRKILYYQGDESPGDMLQALDSLGYSEQDIGESVRVRFGWSAENMPTLIQDLKEFQPELVFIDSLSTANRFSIYRESEMEYARPILEMTGLATQYKTTFVIIHHTNKEGGVRGTTAIRNAVSEVWTLTKDNKETATPYDRILEIDKSRSRSSNKKYRMYFNPDDLSFTFLGEEGDELGGLGQSAKESTLQLLADNRNIKFTSEEIAYRLGLSKAYARRYLGELSADGMISVKRQPGKANTYFLAFKEGSPKDHPSDHLTSHTESVDSTELQLNPEIGIKNTGSPQDHPSDHLPNVDIVSNTSKGDPQTDKNSDKTPDSEILIAPSHIEDHLRSNALPDNSSVGDPVGDPTLNMCENIQPSQIEVEPLPVNDLSASTQGDPGGDPGVIFPSDHHPTPSATKLKLPLLPLLEEKGIYWSASFKREVKVFLIFDEMTQASCQIPGRGTFSLEFRDLQCCEQSPRHDFKVGDMVVILTGKLKETFATITDIRADGIWLKSEDRKKRLAKPFWPHQLAKA
ncbi:MAG: DnaB-like helicase N-terminal domain-containing protein [Nostoc sp.]